MLLYYYASFIKPHNHFKCFVTLLINDLVFVKFYNHTKRETKRKLMVVFFLPCFGIIDLFV